MPGTDQTRPQTILGTFKQNGTAELEAEGETGDLQVPILLPVLMQFF